MNQPISKFLVELRRLQQTMAKQITNIPTIFICINILPICYHIVSIRSTPYCISQNNIVTLHGGIIFLILRQEYEV